MSSENPFTLFSWVDLYNDPFGDREAATPGPTLSVIADPASPYFRKIKSVRLFYMDHESDPNRERALNAASQTREEILKRAHGVEVMTVPWNGSDPTDFGELYQFLSREVQKSASGSDALLLHLTAGPPAVQTVFLLMVEDERIDGEATAIKSIRREHRGRHQGKAAEPVSLNIPTINKVFKQARPKSVSAPEEDVFFDPDRFASEALKNVFSMAQRFAQLNVPILILGERGTGKTTLASWIRINSPYRNPNIDQKWPSVPCGQYTPETMRAELFGYVQGAFTDAKKDRTGLLHAANGDTLFLDEVGDIDRSVQRLLIRALEEKVFNRLGSEKREKSNFRLITATNLEWDELESRLDADFLDRISVFKLSMPPLRQIREELPWLWRSVYRTAVLRSGVNPENHQLNDRTHQAVVTQLVDHPLPGNLRDLFAIAHHIIAMSLPGRAKHPDLVEDAFRQALTRKSSPQTAGPVEQVVGAFLRKESLDAIVSVRQPLSTKSVFTELRGYFAHEVRRIARHNAISVERLIDVGERTLQKWVK